MMIDEGSARRENFQAIYFKPWRHWQLNNRVQGKVNRGPEKVRGTFLGSKSIYLLVYLPKTTQLHRRLRLPR